MRENTKLIANLGTQAATAGKAADTCPYPAGSYSAVLWLRAHGEALAK
jgi:ribosome modulation factor